MENDEQFEIDSEEKANWVLSKYADVCAQMKRIESQYKARKEELEADLRSLDARFLASLEQWAKGEIDNRGERRKRLTLLQGTVAFRTVPARLTVSEEIDAFRYIGTLGNALEYMQMNPVLKKQEYLKLAQSVLETEGELLPGVDRVPERESFSIKTGGE